LPDPAASVTPARQRASEALRQLGLLGEALDDAGHYRVGERFLDCITLVGCAPDIRIAPETGDEPGDGRFIHLWLGHLAGALVYREGLNPKPPLCPSCRQPVADWRTWVTGWQERREPGFRCDRCTATSLLPLLTWRDGAVIGESFIDIIGIHPHEAVPNESFLAALHRLTACRWRHLYL